jgi:hypothetical protein
MLVLGFTALFNTPPSKVGGITKLSAISFWLTQTFVAFPEGNNFYFLKLKHYDGVSWVLQLQQEKLKSSTQQLSIKWRKTYDTLHLVTLHINHMWVAEKLDWKGLKIKKNIVNRKIMSDEVRHRNGKG